MQESAQNKTCIKYILLHKICISGVKNDDFFQPGICVSADDKVWLQIVLKSYVLKDQSAKHVYFIRMLLRRVFQVKKICGH